MKSVMLSIQPKWCEKIVKGEKTIEVRKSRPKIETPFKCYIYMTATKERCRFCEYIAAYQNSKGDIMDGSQKVIGEFICDKAYSIKNRGSSFVVANEEQSVTNKIARQSCLDYYDMVSYLGNKDGYGLHITALKIYDKPKELSEFWVYNEELHKLYESDEDYCAWGNSATESGCPTNDCEGTDLLQCYKCWEDWSGWCHKLKKAPQSWCYVEELK